MDFGGIHSCPEIGFDRRAVDNVRYWVEKRDEELVGPRLREAAFGTQREKQELLERAQAEPKRIGMTGMATQRFALWNSRLTRSFSKVGKSSIGGGPNNPPPVQDGDRDFGHPGSILFEKGADRPGSVLLEKGADRPGVYLLYAEVGRAVLHMSCHPVSLSLSLSVSLSLSPLSLRSLCLSLSL